MDPTALLLLKPVIERGAAGCLVVVWITNDPTVKEFVTNLVIMVYYTEIHIIFLGVGYFLSCLLN